MCKEVLFILWGDIFKEYSAYALNFKRYINILLRKYKCKIIIPKVARNWKCFRIETIQKNKNLGIYNVYYPKKLGIVGNVFYTIAVSMLYFVIRPSIVVLSVANTFLYPFLYVLFKLKRPKQVIVYMHDPIPETWLARLPYNYNRFIRKMAYYFGLFVEKISIHMSDVVLIPCRSMKKIILKRNFVDKSKKILLVFNTTGAVELLRFRHTKITKRNSTYFSYKPVIIYPTMIQRTIRGIELILSTLSKLKSKDFNPLLLIIGEGKKDWIIKLAQKYGVRENIMLYSKLSPEDLAKLYKYSDFIILPPLEILLPTKFFESLAFGIIPIVWFKNEDILSILKKVLPSNLIKRILYYNSNPEEIRNIIRRLQTNKKSYRKIRELLQRKGKAIIIEHHMIGEESFKRSLNIERDV